MKRRFTKGVREDKHVAFVAVKTCLSTGQFVPPAFPMLLLARTRAVRRVFAPSAPTMAVLGAPHVGALGRLARIFSGHAARG